MAMPNKHKGKAYDRMCLTCAEYFLADEPALDKKERADRLAQAIQKRVDEWIQAEKEMVESHAETMDIRR